MAFRRFVFGHQYENPTVIRVNTALGDGLNRIRIPIYNYDNRIDRIEMGDGTSIVPSVGGVTVYNYSSAGEYDVRIYPKVGLSVQLQMQNKSENDLLKYTKMIQFGNFEIGHDDLLSNPVNNFFGCQNLDFSEVVGAPVLKANLYSAFRGVKTISIKNWKKWDWSNVKILAGLLAQNNLFNDEVPNFPNITGSNGTVFSGCSSLANAIPTIYAVDTTALLNFASGTVNYTGRLDFITSSALTDMRNISLGSSATALTISECSGITSGFGGESQYGFGTKLKEITLGNYALDLDVRQCTLMTTTAYLNLINSLADLTGKAAKTLTVKNNAAFTAACSTAAAAKNWTVLKV